MPKNVRDLGKLIVAKGFKKMPKARKIAQSGHTGQASSVLNHLEFFWIECQVAIVSPEWLKRHSSDQSGHHCLPKYKKSGNGWLLER